MFRITSIAILVSSALASGQKASKDSNETVISDAEHLERRETLGAGGFGQVTKCLYRKNGKSYASKGPISRKACMAIVTEKEILQKLMKLKHPNIVRCKETKKRTHKLILELADKDLKTLSKEFGFRVPSAIVKDLARQILSGLEAIHAANIIHRDIKEDNILLFECDGKLIAKVTDFGLAKEGRTCEGCAGTTGYMAPEVDIYFDPYDNKVDIYSFGVMMENISDGKCAAFRKIVKECQSYDPDNRPSAAQLLKRRYFQ